MRPSSRFTRCLRAALCLLPLAGTAALPAPDRPAATPPDDDAAVEQAIERAREEHRALEQKFAAEAAALQKQIVEETRALEALHAQETELSGALERVREEILALDGKIDAGASRAAQAKDDRDALDAEIISQMSAFRERFSRSLVAAESPALLERASALMNDKSPAARERVDSVISIYREILDRARTVSVFRTPVKLAGGTIEDVNVLRIGLMETGYYSHPVRSASGFVLRDRDSESGFLSESRGLTSLQHAQIAQLVEDPSAGGLLPADVTGTGIATLQSRYSVTEWFELGGAFMWPLLFVAAFSLLLSLERVIVLTIKSLGIKANTRRILKLVEAGRFQEAERLCDKIGGATGAVIRAALVHRDQDRSVIEDAVQEALLHHTPAFQARLAFIGLCAAVAPLLGLLGTVTGMITTFKMVTLFGTSDPKVMAGGISEALITTEGGLYVAIPSLLLRGVLGSFAEASLGKLESGAISVVLGILKLRREGTRSHDVASRIEVESEAPFELGNLGSAV